MAIRIFVTMQALPGKGAELARLRAPRHAEVRKDPGCEQFDLFQNSEARLNQEQNDLLTRIREPTKTTSA